MEIAVIGGVGCERDLKFHVIRAGGSRDSKADTRTSKHPKALTTCSMLDNIKAHPPRGLGTTEESGLDVEIAIALLAVIHSS